MNIDFEKDNYRFNARALVIIINKYKKVLLFKAQWKTSDIFKTYPI